jgi:2-(1,2-epoxy-1,2-dihydrophenyl)acetyl-CoA isomerase
MSKTVLTQTIDGVAVVTLNRPDRLNALNGESMQALLAATQAVATDPAVACVVLTGAGRGFCAGGDTKDGASRRADAAPELIRGETLRRNAETSRLLREMPKPTIAMINGPVAGAGIGLAGACDLRFAGASATLLSAYPSIGAGGDYGATYVWPKILGAAKARELFLLNEKFGAEAGLRFGLWHRVFPDDALQDETMKVARRLAAGPRSSWAYMKVNLNASDEDGFGRHLDRESTNMGLSTQAFFSALKAQQRAVEVQDTSA